MKIESIDRNSFIDIQYVESEMIRDPSVVFSVVIQDKGFSGQNPNVWIRVSCLQQFIEELNEIENKRKGAARITGLSPNEFSLSIESINSRGYFMAAYQLERTLYLENTYQKMYVGGRFDYNISDTNEVVKFFSKLI